MTTKVEDLLRAIDEFSLDEPGSDFTFTQRLARENRWDLGFARRVVGEYKRFMLLAAVAGHPVTPSQQVDQAWHLHLIYTRSYWDDLCGRVLGQAIHHGPTRGGSGERAKFRDWYERTKASYATIFNQPPPADIWPPTEQRFGEDLHGQWVSTQRNWIIPKPRLPRSTYGLWAALVLALLLPFAVVAAHVGADKPTSLPWRQTSPANTHPDPWTSEPWPPGLQSERDCATLWLLVLAIVITVVMSLAAMVNDPTKCTSCGQGFALVRTGITKQPDKGGASLEQWQCSHCGHTVWKEEHSSAAGGCGGCGGCGDGGCDGCGGCGG